MIDKKEMMKLAVIGLDRKIQDLQQQLSMAKDLRRLITKRKPSPLKGRRKLTLEERQTISKRMKAFHRKKKKNGTAE